MARARLAAVNRAPLLAGLALAVAFAIGIAADVYRIPVQVSDSREIIEAMAKAPSAAAAFVAALRTSDTMLRPTRQFQTKVLLDAADGLGGAYHVMFRGYHAVTAALLILVFAWRVGARRWVDVAALAFGLSVLVGMHTFSGMVREAYPVNHFLLVALLALGMGTLAQGRPGWLADAGALLLFGVAAMTLESGLLLAVIAGAGYAAGWRGISRRGLAAIALAAAGYLTLRYGFLQMHSATLGSRQTGFGAAMLSVAEQEARFGDQPLPLYVYTVLMSAISVLLSQPSHGQWTVAAAMGRGAFAPVFLIEMATSLTTTALIVWYGFGRGTDGRPRWREPLPFVFLALLVSNSVISFSYAKNEIVSVAGVFYALLAATAMRTFLDRPWQASPRTVGVAAVVTLVCCGWAVRDVGLHSKMQRSAFEARNEWATVLTPGDTGLSPVAARLGEDALGRRVLRLSRTWRRWMPWWDAE